MELTKELREEYARLFAGCRVRPEHLSAVDKVVEKSLRNQQRYETVARRLAMPWFVVAVIHSLESGQSFSRHLHNGDPLTARTTHVPAGRPRSGQPPFTWEVSAADALKGQGLHKVGTWTVPVMLFRLEQYNGFGYRRHHPEVLSPYLWSFTNKYRKGKFVADGKFSATAVSKQVGAVAVIRRLHERKEIELTGTPTSTPAPAPGTPSQPATAAPPPFPGVALRRGVAKGRDACLVQERLRHLGFAIDRVAGCPYGPQTEAAVKEFQADHGLQPSGRVGRDTWRRLFSS